MNPRLSSLTRRVAVTAFATAILAGSLAGSAAAASPAGDVLDADYEFRDVGSVAVLAVYPYSDSGTATIGYFRVKGPKVSAMASYPLASMTVRWRVIVKVAPKAGEPFKVDSKTGWRYITANKVGDLEQFKNRTVQFKDRTGHQRVRIISRLEWIAEDGGTMAWAKHTYGRYGLAQSTGLIPAFGDQSAVKFGSAPNTFTFK